MIVLNMYIVDTLYNVCVVFCWLLRNGPSVSALICCVFVCQFVFSAALFVNPAVACSHFMHRCISDAATTNTGTADPERALTVQENLLKHLLRDDRVGK